MTQRDLLHFLGRGHFKVKRLAQRGHQPIDIRIGNMPTILTQMRGDPVCTCLFRDFSCANWIGIGAAARITNRGNVINIDTKAQFSGRHLTLRRVDFSGP